MHNLLESIKESLARATDNQLVHRCHQVAHNVNHTHLVFWYNLRTNKLVYSDDPSSAHNDQELWQNDKEDLWIRGRVFHYNAWLFMSCYGKNDLQITNGQLRALKSMLEVKLTKVIDFIVDYDGYEIEL